MHSHTPTPLHTSPPHHQHPQLPHRTYSFALAHADAFFMDVQSKPQCSLGSEGAGCEVGWETMMRCGRDAKEKDDADMVYVRRGCQMVGKVGSREGLGGHSWAEASLRWLQCWAGLENVRAAFKKKKQVEIVKTAYPHGVTLQVSYVAPCQQWIVADGIASSLLTDQQKQVEENSKLHSIINFWKGYSESLKEKETIKARLSQFTLCGKIIKNWKEVVFHSVIMNESGEELQPFEAREFVEKMGLKFVTIKSIGIFNSMQNLTKSLLRSAKSIQAQFCEAIGNVFGRSRLLLVRNDGKLLGGCCAPTAEDSVLLKMRRMIEDDTAQQMQKGTMFKKTIDAMSESLPYPCHAYEALFWQLINLVGILEVKGEQMKAKWFVLPKLCLYLLSKRLPFSKFAKIYFQEEYLSQISLIPLEQFGPIDCQNTLIYYLVHPSAPFKQHFAAKMSEALQTIDLTLSIFPSSMATPDALKKAILQGRDTTQHCFILASLSIVSLKQLERTLNASSRSRFFRVMFIGQSFKEETVLNENSYPFSWTTIVNSYLWALRSSNKNEERVNALKKVSAGIKFFQNWEMMGLKNRVSVALQDYIESKETKRMIEGMLGQEREADVALLQRLWKCDEGGDEGLTLQVTNVLKKSYFSIRTIGMKSS